MSDALNASLKRFSSVYASTSSNARQPQDLSSDETVADDEDWWTPRPSSNKRRLDSKSPDGNRKVQRSSKSPKPTESVNRFSELSDMDAEDDLPLASLVVSHNSSDGANITNTSNINDNHENSTNIIENSNIISNNISSSNNGNNNTTSTSNSGNRNPNQLTGNKETSRNQKPPPIVIKNCESLNGLIRSTDKIVHPTKYSIKCHTDNSVSILAADSDAYRAITKSLTIKKVPFHTWQLKEERSFRIVIRGVHHSIPDEDIKESLTSLGHNVRFVNRPRSRFDKSKLVNLVFVELEPAANNKEVHELKVLCRQRVQVELPHKKDDIASRQQWTNDQQHQQFPPLGSRNRKLHQQSNGLNQHQQHPTQDSLSRLQKPAPKQQQDQQQQSSQQHRNVQNDRQWQRQEQKFMRSDEKMPYITNGARNCTSNLWPSPSSFNTTMSQIGLKIGVWNADGLANKALELEFFVRKHHIDIMLVSETHFSSRSYYKLQGSQQWNIKVLNGSQLKSKQTTVKLSLRLFIAHLTFCVPPLTSEYYLRN
ncbi:putative uncharacterized protein DDB_G0292292 [Drosophila rhopaloa]|uniref:Pre-C2HC domain-containing protein n=1 Tax=Drosophila rhopaloa TaxID=1041015 RepID=A0ABM5JFI6_DRORH|nr:putative uncharacterized protein DDB_G0292292 [Drosophila rhopaloa]